MRVFVTGGTGFVGNEIVRELAAQGHSLKLLVRYLQGHDQLGAIQGLSLHEGDVTNLASLDTALDGVDAVVHLVGIISEVGNSTFENIHVRGTQNILSVAQKEGVRRFVHMSALGTRVNAASRYHQTKWAAEEAVRASGLDWTIFRPSLIYGPCDQFVNLFARMSRFSLLVPILGNPKALFNPISVGQVAKAFARSLTEPASVGQAFALCGPQALTLRNIVEAILEVLGRRRWKAHIPQPIARLQAAGLEWIFPHVLGKAPPLNRDQLIMLQEGNTGDGRQADSLFGLKHTSFRDGIAAYLRPR